MEILRLLSDLFRYSLILAIFVFVGVGIKTVYDQFRKNRWEKKYGDKWRTMEEETKSKKEQMAREAWVQNKQMQDQLSLLEDFLKSIGHNEVLKEIDKRVREKDHESEYNQLKEQEELWKCLAMRSMAGTLPDGIRNLEDWEEYVKHRAKEVKPTGSSSNERR